MTLNTLKGYPLAQDIMGNEQLKMVSPQQQDHEKHLKSLQDFLERHGRLWREEVVDLYPHDLSIYPPDWVEYLDGLESEKLWQVDARKISPQRIENLGLRKFVEEMEELTALPWAPVEDRRDMPSWAFFKVREKKRHEIMCLASFLQNLRQHSPSDLQRITDIGGGVGHLARVLAFYFKFPFSTIDRDAHFHEQGKRRLNKYPRPDGACDVSFHTCEISPIEGKDIARRENQNADNELLSLFGEGHFSIGLHTCGGLALSHFDLALKSNSSQFLNFGCCYNKLNPKTQLHLSKKARSNPLKFTKYALTLATRGHNQMTWKDYQLKERVKKFRYTLHLYLYYHHGIKEMISVGDERPQGYSRPFGDYAVEKLKKLGLEKNPRQDLLESFFQKEEIQKSVRKMYLCNVIRWQMGRTIEHYILRDRALFLEENNYNVHLLNYFQEALSPRNIGLYAYTSNSTPP